MKYGERLSKMRALFSAILCIFMIGCVAADDLILGERQEGDYVVTSRTIFRPAIPWIPMKAIIVIKTPSHDTIINQVSLSNIGDKKADFKVIYGGIGTHFMMIMASAKRGEGMYVRVEGFAIQPVTTTDAPTTTELPSTQPQLGNPQP